MKLSDFSLAKMEKRARVHLRNPYTNEPLFSETKGKNGDVKQTPLVLNVFYAQSPEVIERVRDFKRENEDAIPTETQFIAMLIESVEGDMESDTVKLTNATLKDLDKVTKFLEEADFVAGQIIEVSSELKNYAPKTLKH